MGDRRNGRAAGFAKRCDGHALFHGLCVLQLFPIPQTTSAAGEPQFCALLQAYLLQRVLGPEGPRRSTVVSTVLHEVQRKFFTLADDEDERGAPLVGGLKGVNVTR